MSEESWSIRKMREERKRSTVRNTYKRSERVEEIYNTEKSPLPENDQDGLISRFFNKLVVILEE